MAKHDFSHSLKGIVCGLVVLGAAIANLTLFFGLYVHANAEVSLRPVANVIKLFSVVGYAFS
jgi:hypothetical protein